MDSFAATGAGFLVAIGIAAITMLATASKPAWHTNRERSLRDRQPSPGHPSRPKAASLIRSCHVDKPRQAFGPAGFALFLNRPAGQAERSLLGSKGLALS